MSGQYTLPSVQRIADDLKRETDQIISNAANLKNGEGHYKTFTYNTIQFTLACWMTPTGLKVRYKVFKEIVPSINDVIQIINNYWSGQKRK